MSLRLDKKSPVHESEHRGTAFYWSTSLAVLACGMPLAHLLKAVAFPQLSASACTAAVAAFSMYQSTAWNSIHPQMHGMPDVSMRYGGALAHADAKGVGAGVAACITPPPPFHHVPIRPARALRHAGLPGARVLPKRLLTYLVRQHEKHHTTHGRKNFNVTLPGADLLLGTYA